MLNVRGEPSQKKSIIDNERIEFRSTLEEIWFSGQLFLF